MTEVRIYQKRVYTNFQTGKVRLLKSDYSRAEQ